MGNTNDVPLQGSRTPCIRDEPGFRERVLPVTVTKTTSGHRRGVHDDDGGAVCGAVLVRRHYRGHGGRDSHVPWGREVSRVADGAAAGDGQRQHQKEYEGVEPSGRAADMS